MIDPGNSLSLRPRTLRPARVVWRHLGQSRSVGPGSCPAASWSYIAAISFRRSMTILAVIAAAYRRAFVASSRTRSASVVSAMLSGVSVMTRKGTSGA